MLFAIDFRGFCVGENTKKLHIAMLIRCELNAGQNCI